MQAKTRVQLSAMMFAEYFIWGAWFVTMGTYLTNIGFQGTDIGAAYSTTAWAAIISSFFVSLVADKYFAAEKLTGILHIAGAALLYAASTITTATLFFWVLLMYTICYMPTIALTNAIAFRQTTEAGKDFPRIRVMGTIGWIVAGLAIGSLGIESGPQPMRIAAGVSFLMGILSFFLPHTPPKPTGDKIRVRDILGLDALKLMKDRSFFILILGSLFITLPFAMYHPFTNMYLNEIGIANAAGKMTLGQMSEVVFMIAMPWFFVRLGLKKMLLVGMFAWVARFLLYAFGNNAELVFFLYIGIMLHGVCYDFFYVTGQIYVDKKAPADLRASVQGFMTFVTYGVGWLIGAWAGGAILQEYQLVDTMQRITGHDWRTIMIIPAGIAAIVTILFMTIFREEKEKIEIDRESLV
jgi:nucleoside transporter